MTEQDFDPSGEGAGNLSNQHFGASASAGSGAHPAGTAGPTAEESSAAARGHIAAPEAHAALGPFTLREVVVLASVLVLFIGSVLPIASTDLGLNLWNGASLFFIGIGIVLPMAVALLFLVRRLAPESSAARLRLGSLSVDQFASVVAAFATAFFFLSTVADFAAGFLVALIGALGLLAATVAAPLLPVFAGDFNGRSAAPAHLVARHALPVRAKPAAQRPKAAKPAGTRAAVSEAATPMAPAAFGPGQPVAGETVPAAEAGHYPAGAAAGAAARAAAPAAGAGPLGSRGAWDDQHAVSPQPQAPDAGAVGGHSAAAQTQLTPTVAHDDDLAHPTAPYTPQPTTHEAPEYESFAHEGFAAPGQGAAQPTAPEAAASHSVAEAGTRAGTGAGVHPGEPAAAAPSERQPEYRAEPEPEPEPEPEHEAQPEAEREDQPVREAEPLSSAAAAPPTAVHTTVPVQPQSIGATVDPASRQGTHEQGQGERPEYDAFWFAVDRPRAVVDEKSGGFLYNVEPGSWILALQDRGHDFLVQNTDGRVGVLRDLSNIERAPEGD